LKKKVKNNGRIAPCWIW